MRRLFVRTAAAAAVLAAASTAPAAAQIPTSVTSRSRRSRAISGAVASRLRRTGPFQPARSRWPAELRVGRRSRLHAERQHLVRADLPAPVHRRNVQSHRQRRVSGVAQLHGDLLDQLHPRRRAVGVRRAQHQAVHRMWPRRHDLRSRNVHGVELGSSTDFSISGEVGFRYMLGKGKEQRIGSAAPSAAGGRSCRAASTPRWCGYYGCYAVESRPPSRRVNSPAASSSRSSGRGWMQLAETPGSARGFSYGGQAVSPLPSHPARLRGTSMTPDEPLPDFSDVEGGSSSPAASIPGDAGCATHLRGEEGRQPLEDRQAYLRRRQQVEADLRGQQGQAQGS